MWGNAGESVEERAFDNHVRLSMCDGPIETVKHIWASIDACLIGFCHKTAEIHLFLYSCAQPFACSQHYQMEEYKNSGVWL